MPSPESSRHLTCPRCGASFTCAGGSECWCSRVPIALPVPAPGGEDCLCPACLDAIAGAHRDQRDA